MLNSARVQQAGKHSLHATIAQAVNDAAVKLDINAWMAELGKRSALASGDMGTIFTQMDLIVNSMSA